MIGEETPFVPFACWSGVYLIVKTRVLDMDFFRVNTDYGPVLFVQRPDFPDVLTTEDDIVVEFIPRT